MKTNSLTIGLDLLGASPAVRAPALLALRCAPGHACGATISALPRSVGDRRHAVCVLDASGDIVAEETIANTRECLEAFAQRHPAATIAMETGTHSPWVSRLFAARGPRVLVGNARKLRVISSSTKKSDAEDARMLFVAPPACGGHPCSSPSASLRAAPAGATISALPRSVARLGRVDPKLLSPIQHRSETGQRELVKLKVREALVRGRNAG